MASFVGFGAETSRYLRALGRHNEKKWFDAHRADYEEHYIEPAKAFVVALGKRLQKIAPNVVAEPRVNGSIFRVNRDIRFSKDKTPYKDHIDLWFWEGPSRKEALSSFFVRIRADAIEMGVGSHGFDKVLLARYRASIADDAAAARLLKAAAKVERAGYPIQGESYKKRPRGFESISDERDRLLRHGALYCSTYQSWPTEMGSGKLVPWCIAFFRKVEPLHRWIVSELGDEGAGAAGS